MAQLAAALDDTPGLLANDDRTAPERHSSLAAAAESSYRLLAETEQRMFRLLAVFPAPFTLDAAEQVVDAVAREAVPRLIDCSLLAPPQAGVDGRFRYLMLQTPALLLPPRRPASAASARA